MDKSCFIICVDVIRETKKRETTFDLFDYNYRRIGTVSVATIVARFEPQISEPNSSVRKFTACDTNWATGSKLSC